MRYAELLNEAPLPRDFEPSDWGYWIEADGSFRPVDRHQHHAMYRIGWEAFASGRIRVTSVSDPSQVKTETGTRVFAANFFTHFVTKRALQSLMTLLTNYDFDNYTISGMAYQAQSEFPPIDELPIDPRSIEMADTRAAALRCVRQFMTTARSEPPPPLDATPEIPRWQKKRRRR